MIYLDHNATTPVHPEVQRTIGEFLGHAYGNPSSIHALGRVARQAVDGARAALASTTAFLATATEESYGLEYVEALAAGVIGVLPDTTWARALVPEGYPFLWKDAAQAEAMLLRAVSDPDGCRAELDAIAGGDFAGWIANKHNDDDFEQAMLARLQEWF